MAEQIDVPGLGPTLFSPVLAHSLERGDLIHGTREPFWLTARPVPMTKAHTGWLRVDVATLDGGSTRLYVGRNEAIPRAVGARAGGVA